MTKNEVMICSECHRELTDQDIELMIDIEDRVGEPLKDHELFCSYCWERQVVKLKTNARRN